jgi:hypothetical protein
LILEFNFNVIDAIFKAIEGNTPSCANESGSLHGFED